MRDLDLAVDAAIYNIGPAVHKEFNVVEIDELQRHSSFLTDPYAEVPDRRNEIRQRFFGRYNSIQHHVVFSDQIDVTIESINTRSFSTVGATKIVITDNGAPSNDWFIGEFTVFLNQGFGIQNDVITIRKLAPSSENGG